MIKIVTKEMSTDINLNTFLKQAVTPKQTEDIDFIKKEHQMMRRNEADKARHHFLAV